MRISVFGLSVSSAWGNGHATLWRGLLRALVAMGHEVTFFERDTPFYAAHRDLPRGDGYDLVIYPNWESVVPRATRAIERADIAIVTSYQADAARANELVLEGRGVRIFYDLDTPVTLDMLDRGESAPWLPSDGLRQFDLVLSYTGGAALDALATRLGARRVAPLYGSVDVSAHHPVGGHPEWTLSYLATYAPDRQDGVQRLFLDVAERMPSGRFILGGPMYPAEMRWPPNLTYEPHVAPGEHPMFYGASRFTLNLTRGAMKKLGYCPSGRLFEAAACGVPIVSDAWEGLGQFFEPGREIIVANTADDVLRAIASPPDELSRMAHRARERTLAQHTARHRAIELLSLVQSNTVRSAEKP